MKDFKEKIIYFVTTNNFVELERTIKSLSEEDLNILEKLDLFKFVIHIQNIECLNFLMRKNIVRLQEASAIKKAIEVENLEIIKIIISSNNLIKYQERNNLNVLALFNTTDNPDILKILLDSKLNITEKNKSEFFSLVLDNELFEIFKSILNMDEFKFIFENNNEIEKLAKTDIKYLDVFSKNKYFSPKYTKITEKSLSYGNKKVFQKCLSLNIIDKNFSLNLIKKIQNFRFPPEKRVFVEEIIFKEENFIKHINQKILDSIKDEKLKIKFKKAKQSYNIDKF